MLNNQLKKNRESTTALKNDVNSNIKTIFHPCLKWPSHVEIRRELKTGTMNYIAVWFVRKHLFMT